jgi:hypothetical protein
LGRRGNGMRRNWGMGMSWSWMAMGMNWRKKNVLCELGFRYIRHLYRWSVQELYGGIFR